jgi:hypothetical protein
MADDSDSVGRASLWTAIVGIILPIALAILISVAVESSKRRDTAYGLCAVLFVVAELIALVCGFVGRRTKAGKTGLAIALGSLGLILVGALSWFLYSSPGPSKPQLPLPQPAGGPNG